MRTHARTLQFRTLVGITVLVLVLLLTFGFIFIETIDKISMSPPTIDDILKWGSENNSNP